MIRSKPSRALGQRVRRMFAVLVIAFGTITVAATSASAATACSPPSSGYRACLEVVYIGGRDYSVVVTITVPMSQADAAAIVAAPGNAFQPAIVVGDDPGTSSDDDLVAIPLTQEVATSGGLLAGFRGLATDTQLNEDSSSGATDELYARLRMIDPRNGVPFGFVTGVVTGKF